MVAVRSELLLVVPSIRVTKGITTGLLVRT
jgi:hypothetical protein